MTRSEPILAWRSWRLRLGAHNDVSEPLLESCVYGDLWWPRTAFSAECPQHSRPDVSCGCGIYAVTAREAALEWAWWAQSALPHAVVVGRAQLWGRVLPHSAGYRAEHAYPYELELLPDARLGTATAREIEWRLREAYVVDVVPRAAA